MPSLLPEVDPDGLLEYSVVYTDRALNHMSLAYRKVMQDISATMKTVYNAHSVAVVPGSGTFGMEATARQFATGKKCLVLRNGWFSFRWSQIFEMGKIPSSEIVLKARPVDESRNAVFIPAPIETVIDTIRKEKPDLVFAAHVETAAGMMLPDDYMKAVSSAVHEYGGLLVIDSIASGAAWLDMQEIGIDVLLSAPQKGWSGSPCAGIVMLSEAARERIENTSSSSFAIDLKKWLHLMETYESGNHVYHGTMPTDSLRVFRDVIKEAESIGFKVLRDSQFELGKRALDLLKSKGFCSICSPEFQAPGVIVSFTDDPDIKNGSKFAAAGIQIAAGVPLACDEPEGFQTFRIGLFGLEKLQNIDRTIGTLEKAIESFV